MKTRFTRDSNLMEHLYTLDNEMFVLTNEIYRGIRTTEYKFKDLVK